MVFCIILPSCISGGGPRLKSPVSNAFRVENCRAKEKKEKKKEKEKEKKKGKSVFFGKYESQFYTQIPLESAI